MLALGLSRGGVRLCPKLGTTVTLAGTTLLFLQLFTWPRLLALDFLALVALVRTLRVGCEREAREERRLKWVRISHCTCVGILTGSRQLYNLSVLVARLTGQAPNNFLACHFFQSMVRSPTFYGGPGGRGRWRYRAKCKCNRGIVPVASVKPVRRATNEGHCRWDRVASWSPQLFFDKSPRSLTRVCEAHDARPPFDLSVVTARRQCIMTPRRVPQQSQRTVRLPTPECRFGAVGTA